MDTEEKIRGFVDSFREKIEPLWTPDLLWEKFKGGPGMPKSAGYCGPSSVLLWEELNKTFPNEVFSIAVGRVYSGSEEWIYGKHVWVVWHHKLKAATIIDITADQSGKMGTKVNFDDADELARKNINYIPYRSLEEVDESPRKRAAILKKRIADSK